MKLKKLNVILENSLIIWLDKKAKYEMKSRSCYMRDIIRSYMEKKKNTVINQV